VSRIPKEVAAEVIERANGGCELPGCLAFDPSDTQPMQGPDLTLVFHHRQARAMGGSKGRDQDTAANLMYLHQGCHRRVHSAPLWAREHGYIVSQYQATPSPQRREPPRHLGLVPELVQGYRGRLKVVTGKTESFRFHAVFVDMDGVKV
jgi:hypothetical protein